MGAIERFEAEFRCASPLDQSLRFSDAGLMLGAGIVIAPLRGSGAVEKRDTALDFSGEDRILALFTAAFMAPVDAALLAKLRRAGAFWAGGEKALAQIYLMQLGLPRLDEAQTFRLFLADRLIAEGFSPRELCKALGFALPAGLKKYSPDQPRDDHGRWTVGEGSSATQPAVTEGRSVSPGGHRGGEESEDDKLEDFKSKFEEDSPQEDLEHGRPIDPLGPTPFPVGEPVQADASRYTAPGNNYSLNRGQQDKHIEGTNNFTGDRGVLSDPDPQGLLDRFAGTGKPANAVPPGQPGYKERVDFGRIIGEFYDDKTKQFYPTSNGIIHYGKNGAHIVPSRR